MTMEDFHDALRTFLRREPFQPFIVELEGGEEIRVDQPTVAFNAGFAGYLSPTMEILEFACENVRQIRPAAQGVTS